MITILTQQHSIINQYLVELRNTDIQKDRMRFRRNLERVGELMGYEISKELSYRPAEVDTPLGRAETHVLTEQPVLLTIIRAGLPFHQGFMNIFDEADCGFIGAYRHTKKSGEFEIHKTYQNTPDLEGKVVIVADTMLATGQSLVLCCKELLAAYNIRELHVATVIASEEGVRHVQAYLPKARLWIGDLDKELTSKAYIVPGLGDAGDLSYGEKDEN